LANVALVRRKAVPYAFIAPLGILLLVVNLYPILYSLYLSLSVWPIDRFLEGPHLAGLVNYSKLLHTDRMWGSVSFMIFYVVGSISLEFLIGMIVALLLDSRLIARGLVRSIVVLPLAVAPLAVALTWRNLFDVDYGLINWVLGTTGPRAIIWLSTLPWARIAIVIVDVWIRAPFVAIVLLAGLQAIPDDYTEAARIDGGSAWQIFWRITFPLLRPSILVLAVFLTTDAVRMFDLSYAITNGGPYATTETLSFYSFMAAFQYMELPLAAAISWFVFGLNLLITVIFFRILWIRVEV
jgi:multiple sugar transport system permease protein